MLDSEKLCTWPRNRLEAVEGDRRPGKPSIWLFGELNCVLSGFQRRVGEQEVLSFAWRPSLPTSPPGK